MSKVLQLKRGNTAKNDAYTGAIAELTVDTQAKNIRLHDGVTAGGKVVGGLTSVSWNDVTDKPTIPSMTSQLTNDSNFVDTLEATQIANNSASNAVTNHNGNSNAHSNIITPIKNVIPSAATSSNQLADKKWVQSTLESFAGIIYKVKGSVATYNDLPQNAQPGDVYNVTDTGANYVYVDYTDIDSSKSTDIGTTVVNVSNQYALLSKFNEWGTTQNADITHLTLQKTSAEATTYTVKYYWMASDQEGEDPTEHSQTLNNISTNVLGNWGITITTFDATTVLAITRNKLGWDKLSETFELDALKQKSTLPTASLTELGNIYQYTGTTDANYTHGYVYECVETLAPYVITTSGTFSDPNLTIDEDIFLSYVQPSGDTVLTFTWDTSLTPPGWKLNDERVNVFYYGISFRSLPANGDTLIVTYTAPHSNNPKTYGWKRVDVQPADTDSGSFVATYGTTTYNEITVALNHGKQCYCDYNGRRYYYAGIDNNCHTFVSSFRTTHNLVYVYEYDDEWSYEYDVITNNPTITFKQGNDVKGTITLNQSTDQTITFDAGGSGGGQLPDYSTTSDISLESTQGDINLTSSSGGVEINASGTTTINGNEVVLNSSVASGNTAQMTISNADGISIDSGNKPFELHAGSSIDFNSENGIDINFSFNNLTNAEHYAYFSASNFHDFSSSTVNNVELSKTFDTGDDFFEVEVAQVDKATSPSTRVSYTNFNMDTNGGIFEYNLNSSGTTAEIALSSLLDNGVATPVVTASQPTGLSDDEIATTGYVKGTSFESIEVDTPLVKKSFTTNFINDMNITIQNNQIVSYDIGNNYLDPMYFTPNFFLGTLKTTTDLDMPHEFPGSLVLPASSHTLVALNSSYDSQTEAFFDYVLWGYYNAKGEFMPVVINNGSLVLVSSNTSGWVDASGTLGYASGVKLPNVANSIMWNVITTVGDAQKGWQFIVPSTGDGTFKYYVCVDNSGTLEWREYDSAGLGLSEEQCAKIDTCMILGYFYHGNSIATSTNAVYECTGTAYENRLSNVNRGTNILLQYRGSQKHNKVGLSLNFWTGTETEYSHLTSKDDSTLYIIVPDPE